jgi:hypothetical protein
MKLDEVQEALRAAEQVGTHGKIVLTPQGAAGICGEKAAVGSPCAPISRRSRWGHFS